MPIREYQCLKCDKLTENLERNEAEKLTECPDCGGPVEIKISAAKCQFKGSGFYATDSGRRTKQ
jgi:putative FmdB family regulatory protein